MCLLLRPAADACRSVISSSKQFLDLHSAEYIPSDYVIAVIDANYLYPSIDHKHLLPIISAEVLAAAFGPTARELGISHPSLRNITMGILHSLELQFVTYDDMFWRIIVANVYLN